MSEFARVLTGLCAAFMAAGVAGAQPFAVAGAGCGIGQADERGLQRVHWELLDLTEICLETTVRSPPVRLSFVVVYQGERVAGEPISILVRAQTHAWVGPEMPVFTLNIDDRRLDLMSPKRRHELIHPCPAAESCAFDGVVAALTAEELRLIAKASSVSGRVFGSDFTVPSDRIRAVGHLVALLGGDDRAK